MSYAQSQEKHFVQRLQRALPLRAYGRPTLLAFLRSRRLIGPASPRLKVIGISTTGAANGFMCRFRIEGRAYEETFFAPLAHIALDRRHPITREIDSYFKSRVELIRPR
ncbi:MAG: hypothetical protein AB7U61_02140 [Methylocystis sp.]